jgi:hypothetical protein
MADLAPGSSAAGRAANGGARAQGPVPVSQTQQSRLTTPTDIMRRRREREEAKQQAEQGVQQPQLQPQQQYPQSQSQSHSHSHSHSQSQPQHNIPIIPGPPLERPSDIGRPQVAGNPSHITSQSGSHRRTHSNVLPQARPPAESYPQLTSQYSSSAHPGPAGPTNPPRQSQQMPASIDSTAAPLRPRANTQGSQQGAASQSRPTAAAAGPSGTQPRYSQQPSGQSEGQPQRPSATAGASAGAGAGARTPGGSTAGAQPLPSQSRVNAFPHAFERWETLSAHWEGLTSYWIRKLETNTEEMRREPLLQQLSRQVTDLSAAGANLFHAVVELQRLRASSERKFQRWFHETRKDSEGQKEIVGQYERALVNERNSRQADVNLLQGELETAHVAIARMEKQIAEMAREQIISKEEARRAWEELGRREQEERDRVAALREGQPIVVGGMQVFPTQIGNRQDNMQTRAGTGASRPSTRDGRNPQPPPPMENFEAYGFPSIQNSPTNTDPFAEGHVPGVTKPQTTNGLHAPTTSVAPAEASTSQPAASGAFYQQRGGAAYLHSVPPTSSGAPATSASGSTAHYQTSDFSSDNDPDEYEYDEHGHMRRDARGLPIPFRPGHRLASDEDDDFDTLDDFEHERALRAAYGSQSTTAVSYPSIPALTSARVVPTSAPAPAPALAHAPVPPTQAPAPAPAPAPFNPRVSVTAPPAMAPTAPTAPTAPPQPRYESLPPADYEGAGFDELDEDRNYYHSRLSDVPEADEETSRASEISGHSRTPRMAPF